MAVRWKLAHGEERAAWAAAWLVNSKVLGQQLAAAALSTGQRSDGSELEFELGSAEEGRRQNECSGVGCCVFGRGL
ncbi:hypothetical protein M0R45_019716 [Rubus argutus]|uniref:Uncharacterized protein n=1 Tax=Rubus argutus TaxID=59490 RepID=A0AAW1X7J6_RUBAR